MAFIKNLPLVGPLLDRLGRLLMQVWTVSSQTHMGLIAAGVAFYGIFAIFPAMAALIAVFGLISDPELVRSELELLEEFIPTMVYDLISSQMTQLLTASSSTLGWATAVSVGVALWSARAGVSAVVQGLNAIYGISNRSGIRHELVAILMTLSLMAIAVLGLVSIVVTPIVLAIFPPLPTTALFFELIRWVAMLLVVLSALTVIYRFGPNRSRRDLRWLTPGTFTVVILWFASSWALSYYLGNFNRYNEVYGSIGAVIAMLLWLYLSAWLVLAGAAINVVLERMTRAVRGAAAVRVAEAALAPDDASDM